MPFALIPTALGICFCLIWMFIGGMILRDGQLAAQQDRESDVAILPLSTRRIARGTSGTAAKAIPSARGTMVRAAS